MPDIDEEVNTAAVRASYTKGARAVRSYHLSHTLSTMDFSGRCFVLTYVLGPWDDYQTLEAHLLPVQATIDPSYNFAQRPCVVKEPDRA
jgi:hypothetical protein